LARFDPVSACTSARPVPVAPIAERMLVRLHC
jgi:hypothetical protein